MIASRRGLIIPPPRLAQSGAALSASILPQIDRHRAKFGRNHPKSAHSGPHWELFGQCSTDTTPSVGRILAGVCPNSIEFVPNSDRILAEIRPMWV